MQRETKSKPFQMRMRPAVKEAGMVAAESRNMSLNALLEWLLIEHLKSVDLWPPAAEPSAGKRKRRD